MVCACVWGVTVIRQRPPPPLYTSVDILRERWCLQGEAGISVFEASVGSRRAVFHSSIPLAQPGPKRSRLWCCVRAPVTMVQRNGDGMGPCGGGGVRNQAHEVY